MQVSVIIQTLPAYGSRRKARFRVKPGATEARRASNGYSTARGISAERLTPAWVVGTS
jgi:hypothetical protein